MDDLNKAELSAKVKGAIIRVLDLNIGVKDLTDDVSLYSSTVQMDSLALLQLLVTLEQELGVEIDDEDVMNAELSRVGSVVEMVQQVAHRQANPRSIEPTDVGV